MVESLIVTVWECEAATGAGCSYLCLSACVWKGGGGHAVQPACCIVQLQASSAQLLVGFTSCTLAARDSPMIICSKVVMVE